MLHLYRANKFCMEHSNHKFSRHNLHTVFRLRFIIETHQVSSGRFLTSIEIICSGFLIFISLMIFCLSSHFTPCLVKPQSASKKLVRDHFRINMSLIKLRIDFQQHISGNFYLNQSSRTINSGEALVFFMMQQYNNSSNARSG